MSSFDPEQWLDVAEACCERIAGVNEEALLRTALNRAYYAALLSVRQRIEHAQGSRAVPRSRSHAAILGALRAGGAGFIKIHDSLQRLRARREAADYDMSFAPNRSPETRSRQKSNAVGP